MRLDALFAHDPVSIDGGDGAADITGLTADSRTVRPGYLFAALTGSKDDGAAYIGDARARGARAILVAAGAAPDVTGAVRVLSDNPRRALARAAATFYGRQPDVAIAVTGTNGKTSVVSFVRQIWEALGLKAASIGTVGAVGPGAVRNLEHTTPDPVSLHALLAEFADQGVTHVAVEASSHGLAQYRLDGIHLAAGGFTNISRDHLDYHPTLEAYFAAKKRLFTELLPEGGGAVVNVDTEEGKEIARIARERRLAVVSTGRAGETVRLTAWERVGLGQRIRVAVSGDEHEIFLPLVGDFQTANALVAVGLVIAAGGPAEIAVRSLDRLTGARGRLERVALLANGASVFVDYAHTPDALANALIALRLYVSGRLIVVFGAGGDRDPGKRPLMGRVAAEHADIVIVTDDNPRSEDPAAIRDEVMIGCPDATEIDDRREAISRAVAMADSGDIVLIAGKGHETGQMIGGKTIPFSDHDEVLQAVSATQHERLADD